MILETMALAALFAIQADTVAPSKTDIRQPAEQSTVMRTDDEARLYFEFEKAKKKEIEAKLDEFFAEIRKTPGAMGVVMSYGDLKDTSKQDKAFIDYVISSGFDTERITFIGAGKRKKEKYQFWIVPKGASYPEPEPDTGN